MFHCLGLQLIIKENRKASAKSDEIDIAFYKSGIVTVDSASCTDGVSFFKHWLIVLVTIIRTATVVTFGVK